MRAPTSIPWASSSTSCSPVRTPFFSESGEFTEILFKLFTAEPPPVKSKRPDVPDELAAAVHKALAREVDNRFRNALDMAEAIAPFASERSRHVLTRMRAFKAPNKPSIAPPEDLPQSMVAFSQIQHRPPTDVMANRPTTDVMKGPPVTEMLPGTGASPAGNASPAPPQGFIPDAPTAGSQSRLSATPAALEARARPDEASARTQYDSTPARVPPVRAFVAGASTDLSNARDTSAIAAIDALTGAAPKKRSPMIYALPVVAVVIGAGVVFGLVGMNKDKTGGNTPPVPSSTIVVAPDNGTAVNTVNTALPPPSAGPSAAPSAAPSASPSVSPSSEASAKVVTMPSAKASASTGRPPKPSDHDVATPPTGTSVLDTKIKQ